MRVALTGATGIAGQFVLADLLKRGLQINALSRKASTGQQSGVNWRQGDMEQSASLKPLMEGCEALVHCAFSHLPGQYRGGEGDDPVAFWRANLLGSLNVLEAAQTYAIKRVVVLSSRAVFTGQTAEQAISDGDPQYPDGHYGIIKQTTEQLARLYQQKIGGTVAVIRPTGIYGLLQPLGRNKWYPLIQQVMAREKITQVRSSTEVHGKDLARAVWLLLSTEESKISSQGYNCSDLQINTRTLVDMISKRLNLEVQLPIATEPIHPLRTDNLNALGWQPGGLALLEQTLHQLVDAVQAQAKQKKSPGEPQS